MRDAARHETPWQSRGEAGAALGQALRHELAPPEVPDRVVVVGVGEGGLAVAVAISAVSGAPVDILVVERLDAGDAFHPPTYLGAVSDRGQVVIDSFAANHLDLAPGFLDMAVTRARQEVTERARRYRQGGDPLPLDGKTVVVADDGTSDPHLLDSALDIVRSAGCERLVLALPSVAEEDLGDLEVRCDQIVCLETLPWLPWFARHGRLYRDDGVPGESEVRRVLTAPAQHLAPTGQRAYDFH